MSFLGFGSSEGDDDGGNGGLWGAIGAAAIGGLMTHEEQKETNAANWDVANAMMEFQKTMSNTSYQRGVDDMKKAGLNPMLAYSQGGASTPGGSMPKIENPMQAGISGAQQAAATAQQIQQMAQSKATTTNIAAQTEKVKSETLDKNLHSAKLAADIQQTKDSAANLRATADNTQQAILGTIMDSATKHATFEEMNKQGGFAADVAKRVTDAKIRRFELNKEKAYGDYYDSAAGRMEPYIGLGSDVLSSAAGAKRAFNPAVNRSVSHSTSTSRSQTFNHGKNRPSWAER